MIVLASTDHPQRARCEAWFTTIRDYATCPITEGALIRFLVRTGHTISAATAILSHLTLQDESEFWPDTLPYTNVDLTKVYGHSQVTDAYLISLVRHHPGSKLATLDEGLARLYPDETCLIPG
jgi:predicted nucleic acid-binding protein